jgi:hypothetical protein
MTPTPRPAALSPAAATSAPAARLVLLAGVFSGLTLGLLSLDLTNLRVIINCRKQKKSKKGKR